jgi:soluble lytic murein transglycosylase
LWKVIPTWLVLAWLAVGIGDRGPSPDSIQAAIERRDFDRAEELARGLQSRDPVGFVANNYDYLLGRLAERKGLLAEASSFYLSVLNRGSILASYALWHLAAVARARGDLDLEREYLERLIASFPSSAPAAKARDRIIENAFERGHLGELIGRLGGSRDRSKLARLGQAYAKLGDVKSARAIFKELILGSYDDYALVAARELDELDRAAGIKPDEYELLRRARIYMANRHWSEARAHLMDLIERFPRSANRAEALYQIGMAFYREGDYNQARHWFELTHTEFPNKREGQEGYYWVAAALQRAGLFEESALHYIRFMEVYPYSDRLEGAYRNAIDCFRYAGKDELAVEWSRRMERRFAKGPLAQMALLSRANIEMARRNYSAALELVESLRARAPAPKLAEELSFLRAYLIEQMGRMAEAINLYLAVPEGRNSYFGLRATLRLRALGATEEGRRLIEPLLDGYVNQARRALDSGNYAEAKSAAMRAARLSRDDQIRRQMLEILRRCYSHLPPYATVLNRRFVPIVDLGIAPADAHGRLAISLCQLGLYDECVAELRLSDLNLARDDVAYAIAVYASRGDQAQLAMAFSDGIDRLIPGDYQTELLPRELAELLYPAPYRDILNRYAEAYGVDPRFILSLARQESRFNPQAKSRAAARGLMQLIHETALRLARQEGIEALEPDDPYDPETAIRLSCRYVRELEGLFPNNPYAVAAAYNAGEQSVERWIRRAASNDPDRLLAEIPIPETKDYVAKVMLNYQAYCSLYDSALRPRG